MSSESTIAVFAPLYPPAFRGGGPIRSIHALVATGAEAHRTLVITRDTDLGCAEPMDVVANRWVGASDKTVRYVSVTSPRHLLSAMVSLRRQRPTVLYFNSFFDPALSILPQLLAMLRWWGPATRVIAMRGEFRPPALELKEGKKRAYLTLYRGLGLHRRVIWHATSEHEAADVRRVMGESARIVVRGDSGNHQVTSEAALAVREGRLRMMFLGRLVPIKGLVDALGSLRHAQTEFDLDVYGPAEDQAYSEQCLQLAAELPPSVTTRFHGAVGPADIPNLLAEHDLLLMPTHSENFGHVIAEALAAGVPVLLRDVTPWTAWIQSGGGIVVDGPDGWLEPVETFARMPANERLAWRKSALGAYLGWKTARASGHLFDDLVAASRQ